MSKYVTTVTENYRVDTEEEAAILIEEAKNDGRWTLVKYNRTYKEKKSKGEVIDEWYKVSITKKWDDEKEPCGATSVKYSSGDWGDED